MLAILYEFISYNGQCGKIRENYAVEVSFIYSNVCE